MLFLKANKFTHGNVYISKEALKSIIGASIYEVENIDAKRNLIQDILEKAHLTDKFKRGINLNFENDQFSIMVYISFHKNKSNLFGIIQNIQAKIRENIKLMTTLEVDSIDIHIMNFKR